VYRQSKMPYKGDTEIDSRPSISGLGIIASV
jgi:hypothetical protein